MRVPRLVAQDVRGEPVDKLIHGKLLAEVRRRHTDDTPRVARKHRHTSVPTAQGHVHLRIVALNQWYPYSREAGGVEQRRRSREASALHPAVHAPTWNLRMSGKYVRPSWYGSGAEERNRFAL